MKKNKKHVKKAAAPTKQKKFRWTQQNITRALCILLVIIMAISLVPAISHIGHDHDHDNIQETITINPGDNHTHDEPDASGNHEGHNHD